MSALREALEALADQYEREEAYACVNAGECVRCLSFQRVVIRLRAILAAHVDPPRPEGVGTGAGEGAPRQDTGSAWVTRSADCPEAPAQAHPLALHAPLHALHSDRCGRVVSGEWEEVAE